MHLIPVSSFVIMNKRLVGVIWLIATRVNAGYTIALSIGFLHLFEECRFFGIIPTSWVRFHCIAEGICNVRPLLFTLQICEIVCQIVYLFCYILPYNLFFTILVVTFFISTDFHSFPELYDRVTSELHIFSCCARFRLCFPGCSRFRPCCTRCFCYLCTAKIKDILTKTKIITEVFPYIYYQIRVQINPCMLHNYFLVLV